MANMFAAGSFFFFRIYFFRTFRYLLMLVAPLLFLSQSCEKENSVDADPSPEYVYEVHFIDVGQGDAILVLTPEKNLLVDGGFRDSGIAQYLKDQNIDRIDYVIGTHPHADHIGGLIQVMQTFPVGEVIDPGVVHTTFTFNQYLTTIDILDIPFTAGRSGMVYALSEHAHFKLLHPVNPEQGSLNNASIVAHVFLDEVSLLLTGDLEWEGEQEVLSNHNNISSTILKVGHHGSNTSSTTAFLQAVNPEVSVIMCGAGNDYGHPHQQALRRLQIQGADIYRTDLNGHIVVKSDGKEYTVYPERE